MNSLEQIRRLLRDTELKVRLSTEQPVIDHVGLKSAPPPSNLSSPADVLVHVDPITEAYREQFGPPPRAQYTHPEQYDPALRYHVGMPPAVDPHAEARRLHEGLRQERERRNRDSQQP